MLAELGGIIIMQPIGKIGLCFFSNQLSSIFVRQNKEKSVCPQSNMTGGDGNFNFCWVQVDK